MTHEHDAGADFATAAEYWDHRYADRIWGGRVNVVLAQEVESVAPGRVLDLGAGEGGDALWLAQRGWQVTAADISAVALARAQADAEAAGLTEQISFVTVDFTQDFPAGQYDLVSAHFLQSLFEFPRAAVLQRAAAAVAAGGRLLIVDHGAAPPWSNHQHDYFPTAAEVYAGLELVADEWDAPLLESRTRLGHGPDGQTADLVDNVIAVRRRRSGRT